MIDLKNKLLLVAVLVLLALSGCKDNSDSVPNVYELFLEFRDNNGTNLLNDFDVNKFKTDIVIKTDKGDILKGDYSIIERNNKKILKIHSSTLPDNKVNTTTYTIQNEELMGNADKHTLDAKWLFSNNTHVLVELSADGTKLAPAKEDYFSYYVLTRE
jgi:major membrane immunogen (membrane-anchored lipoprotein)